MSVIVDSVMTFFAGIGLIAFGYFAFQTVMKDVRKPKSTKSDFEKCSRMLREAQDEEKRLLAVPKPNILKLKGNRALQHVLVMELDKLGAKLSEPEPKEEVEDFSFMLKKKSIAYANS